MHLRITMSHQREVIHCVPAITQRKIGDLDGSCVGLYRVGDGTLQQISPRNVSYTSSERIQKTWRPPGRPHHPNISGIKVGAHPSSSSRGIFDRWPSVGRFDTALPFVNHIAKLGPKDAVFTAEPKGLREVKYGSSLAFPDYRCRSP